MIITSSALAAYTSAHAFLPQRQAAVEQADERGNEASAQVHISQAAREALAAATKAEPPSEIEARLAKIKASTGRTLDDMNFLLANDKRLAEIEAKSAGTLTADELDYVQKARGFVNTMQNLSPEEKALHDELVAKGEKQAAEAITVIAFVRTMGHTAGGVEGTTYDPINTSITAENIRKFFKHSIVDPTGKNDAQFQSLVRYLQARETETAGQGEVKPRG